jgi:SAM-dependent methyltransferase
MLKEDELMEQKRHSYTRYWECQGTRIIDCQTCGFNHVEEIPNQASLADFYREKYYRDVKPVDVSQFDQATIQICQENAKTSEHYINIYNKVRQLMKTESHIMVDIGCGYELLAYYFQSQGWCSYVIEASQDTREYLKKNGLTVIGSTIEESDLTKLPQATFINLQYVLEHLSEPYVILDKLYQALAPGGIIRICVPNDFSEGHLAYLEHYCGKMGWVCLPDHINYFTFDSLRYLLEKVGFHEVYRTTSFPLELLLTSGMD